jgi:hypothetical protein
VDSSTPLGPTSGSPPPPPPPPPPEAGPVSGDSGTGAGDAGTGTGDDAAPSDGCDLAGQSYAVNTCTETQQCDGSAWVDRSSDPASCSTGAEPSGACITDAGSVVPENTCTSTLQCDNGVWVDRASDPAACL